MENILSLLWVRAPDIRRHCNALPPLLRLATTTTTSGGGGGCVLPYAFMWGVLVGGGIGTVEVGLSGGVACLLCQELCTTHAQIQAQSGAVMLHVAVVILCGII